MMMVMKALIKEQDSGSDCRFMVVVFVFVLESKLFPIFAVCRTSLGF